MPQMTQVDGEQDLAKFAEPDLRQWVTSEEAGPTSVLVQPDLPRRQIRVESSTRGGVPVTIPRGVVQQSPEEEQTEERVVAETRELLESVLGTTPTWLASARTFVVQGNSAQLRQIAASPLVKRIWPNRDLRRSA
jgi:hypothetical protein